LSRFSLHSPTHYGKSLYPSLQKSTLSFLDIVCRYKACDLMLLLYSSKLCFYLKSKICSSLFMMFPLANRS
ncbi:unnamed protein product, partial [Brassica rapa subsp. trilocularis]